MRKRYYLHTLDGKPAYYVPGEQICFACRSPRLFGNLCTNMAQIRKERRASRKWRVKNGLGVGNWREGFVCVGVPV